jgi:hypothetical protein
MLTPETRGSQRVRQLATHGNGWQSVTPYWQLRRLRGRVAIRAARARVTIESVSIRSLHELNRGLHRRRHEDPACLFEFGDCAFGCDGTLQNDWHIGNERYNFTK